MYLQFNEDCLMYCVERYLQCTAVLFTVLAILAGSQWRILLLQSGVREKGRMDTGSRGFLTLVNQRLGRGQLVLTLVKRLVLLDLAL